MEEKAPPEVPLDELGAGYAGKKYDPEAAARYRAYLQAQRYAQPPVPAPLPKQEQSDGDTGEAAFRSDAAKAKIPGSTINHIIESVRKTTVPIFGRPNRCEAWVDEFHKNYHDVPARPKTFDSSGFELYDVTWNNRESFLSPTHATVKVRLKATGKIYYIDNGSLSKGQSHFTPAEKVPDKFEARDGWGAWEWFGPQLMRAIGSAAGPSIPPSGTDFDGN